MTKETDDKLFIYKINIENFFEVSSSIELVKKLDELKQRILMTNKYIIGFDTSVYPGYATLLGVNPKLLNYNFKEDTDTTVNKKTPSTTKGYL